ncbi:MAG TPA: C25 family cysteine peptidase, partial [Candidatus Binatia bacterium]|nr:C25 family cysteine peptidase [Candidatus Binatia bacterium]
PSPANGASVTITWPSSMTVVSITPSSGTTCTAAPPPITCTPPTPFTTAMTATIAVTVTTTTAGSYPSTATVTDSGTPPDPNTGNNTYTAVATIQAIACGTVSQATAGTNLTGTLNTYYPGTASVAAGSTLIPIGTPTGAGTAIAKGNLLLVIQMQDAGINDTNSVLYGNGSTGQGFTALNSAGNYEFVTATGAISSGSVPISGAGLGGGLVFSYDESAATATAGQSTYQVIIVPQYTTASFNAATPPTALPWNGSTGGVLALDTSAALTLNGATVSVSGLGFRGAAGLQLSGGAGAATDFLHSSPATYTGASEAGVDGSKGEGIAGTPMWVQSGTTYLQTNTTEGYPNPAGGDGSMARGAPGNAGGGGTDPDPAANDQNAGGGGGGNGGAGGFGGDSWSTNQSTGGEGGVSFPATINRVVMGGGGGAGGRNNSDGDSQASSAAPGGGIIIIRTYALSGTATFTANGNNAYNGTANDAGGGGGAGGTIVVLSANGGESGLTLQANGGTGGNAWASQPFTWGNRHGPGGGGGGGVVLISGAPASASVAGGANGLTENPGVAYGSTPGTAGFSVTNETLTQTSGILSGAQCTPDMTLGKSHVGNFTRGLPAAYTIPVSNISPYGSTSAIVTVNDTLPTGLAPLSATGTGWACSIVSQTISCTDPTVLPGNSSYPSISVTANVLQTAPATVTNTAVVAGGGEINLSNDTATDVATVVSSADLSVTNAATPDPVAPGAAITYTQVLTNNGPSAADNATFVEAIPANTVFNTFSAPANWTCSLPPSGSTGNIVCTELNLPGSTAATFTLSVFVSPGAAKGTVIADTATASSSTADPNTANNSATAYTVVGSTATGELTVSNSASPNPVLVNNNITYTQVVTNTGSAAATGASFTEATPANTTFVSLSAPAGWTCSAPPVSCTNPSVAAGSSGTFSVVYSVNSGTASGTTITDTATVNASNQAFGANSATATDVVATSGQADLALSTAATPTSVYAGNDITYTQTVSNNGPSAASSVSFTEAVPANTTFASISIPVGWLCTTPAVGAAGNVNCTDTSLASGTSADIIVVVNVAPSITVASITAASSVTASTIDPNSANNSTSVVTPVTEVCDLAVTNNGTPSPVQAGNNIVYTQVVTNNGPSNCAGASLTEAFPNNTTFVSFPAPAGWTCTTTGSISCSDPSFAPNTTSTFTLTVTVPNGTTAGTIIADTVTVSSTTHDINTTNNTATVAIGVASNTQADMSITDSGSPNPVNAGQNVTFTQTVANAGPATATTVKVTETLPTSTTFVSLTGPAGWSCTNTAPYTCSNPSMNSATNATISFVVAVASTVASGSPIADTASVSSVTGDPNLNNNTAASTVYVADSADLSVTNAASPVPVTAGSNITYTQVVNNAGPSTATSSTLTESTPPNTTFQSITIPSGWSCTTPAVGSAGTINCSNPSFAAGSSSFTVVVKVAAGTAAGTAVNDTVTVASSVSDPNTANNTATANDVVATGSQADLVTTNSALPASVAAGSNVTYSQSVTNLGPAVASSPVTLTEPTPPNTNFQSITPPTGWTCTTPAVGAAGTITCTDGSTLALNAPANFTLALQVNPGTPSGTTIAETATANAGNIVPNLTTNSATATVIVANANSADMAIVKTATPNGTVVEGDTLTYTLSVTNNGPATATNVTVVDPLPSAVTYLQANSTAGSCSEAGGTVTCLLGTMNNGATATVTVLTLATASGMATNTATVSADQVDPNLGNNTSTQTETITLPTSIKLQSFMAHLASSNGASGVVLQWKTGGESHNLGFNVYREQQGERVQLNSSLIAGSALLMAGAMPKHAAKTYAWIDNSPNPGSEPYWLEDVDVSGARTMHGPVTAGAAASDSSVPAPALMVPQLNQRQATSALGGHMAESVRHDFQPTPAQRQKQFEIAANPAVKILVEHEGWHRVTQPELLQVGLDPNVDPALLHLYAEAMEQPIAVTGATPGPGGFGPQAAIEFYGTGIDTPYSGERVYWLVAEGTPGQRIPQLPSSTGSNQPPASFPFTVELTPHTTYFSALITTDGQNFFGPLISNVAYEQAIDTPHFDPNSAAASQLEIVLQGVVLGFPHDVSISLNGTSLGELNFSGQQKGRFTANLPPGVLQAGSNTVTLTAQNGEYDTSLLQSMRITYPHLYAADSDLLKFTAHSGEQIQIAGFKTSAATVLDITDPRQPIQLSPVPAPDPTHAGRYTLQLQVPWAANASSAGHTLLALGSDRILAVAGLRRNHPSRWHQAQQGSEIVMISAAQFASALVPLVSAHEKQSQSSAVVPVDDLYDEFTFGEHNPWAIRAFLRGAGKNWRTPPHYLLLNGRASLDPRNYLGFGYLDFVPTRIVPTSQMMTASDDWFSDFNDTGFASIATGRFPVSTPAEAELIAGKVATYEGQSTSGAWTSQALMVADFNDTENFTQDSQLVQAQLPKSLNVTDVFASTMTSTQAAQEILDNINAGQILVNYSGHGSEDQWSGSDLFDNTTVASLTNGSSLPVFLIMDCLNGFFQDVYDQPLAVTLMLAENGGAVAVLASSSLNQPAPQTILDKLIAQQAFNSPYPALGDAILKAKSGITDIGVRKTYNLLGDPAMQIKSPATTK